MTRFFNAAGLAVLVAIGTPVLAQHQHHGAPAANPHAGHGTQTPAAKVADPHAGHGAAASAGASSEASKALNAAMMKMHKDMAVSFTGNPESDFVRGMIPHHQGAIDMAEIVLKFGKDAAIKTLATNIISAQKKEIAEMQAWLARNGNGKPANDAKEIIEAYESVNHDMHVAMDVEITGDPDRDFMQGMIPHHEGAVEMAKVLLRHGKSPELLKLAEDIIRSQTVEIVEMIAWLRKAGG
jgi:uncharacterized protein (DUF305 family)